MPYILAVRVDMDKMLSTKDALGHIGHNGHMLDGRG